MSADVGRVPHQLLLEQPDGLERCSAGDRVPAKRAGMRARRPRHQVRARHGDAERQARGDALGDGDRVWLHAGVLDREHATGATHARLHFVSDEDNAVGLRQCAQPLEKLVRGDEVAALALNRFDDDGGDLVG